MLTIIIPIIKFNYYSKLMMKQLGNTNTIYENLSFLFAVSNNEIKQELEQYIEHFVNRYTIIVANSTSSNKLRSYCIEAKTPYIYFQDCDDWVDYNLLNNFVRTISVGDTIYCFNVLKHHYDLNNKIYKEDKILFKIPNGEILNICDIPTCVYSKIIPTKYTYLINFPNLPYTQDWAISYQLYTVAKHVFDNRVSYFYNNYDSSSSSIRNDTPYRVKRVAAYSRNIIDYFIKKKMFYEADYLEFMYSINLFSRFRNIGINILPKAPSFRLLLKANNRTRVKVIYHYIKNVVLSLYIN